MSSDHYVSTGMKVADFCWGFFGMLCVFAVLVGMIGTGGGYRVATIGALGLLGWLVGVVMAFANGRRFIGIGMLCTLLVPLLAVGACFVMLSGR